MSLGLCVGAFPEYFPRFFAFGLILLAQKGQRTFFVLALFCFDSYIFTKIQKNAYFNLTNGKLYGKI